MHACSVALVREAVLPAGVAETPIAALGTVEGKHPAGAGVTRLVPIMGTVAPMLVPCVAPAKIPAEIPEAVLGVDSSEAEEATTTVVQATAEVRHLEAATATLHASTSEIAVLTHALNAVHAREASLSSHSSLIVL